jgi:hypothetical protein
MSRLCNYRVYSGANGALLLTVTGVSEDEFGSAFARLGDVDSDGIPDFAVGAPSPAYVGPTYVRGFSGATGTTLFTAIGSNYEIGYSLAGIGDVNGDGIPDVASGPTGGPGPVSVHSGSTGAALLTLDGTGGVFGRSVASAGDVNGDGIPEIAVGAPVSSQVRVYSIAGMPSGSSTFGSGCPGSSGAVPTIQTAGGNPSASVGNPKFSIVLSNALPSAPALLIGGISNTFWSSLGIPLPVNLAVVGFPACSLAVSAEVVIPATTTADGVEFAPMPVPANAALVGQSVYFQWFVLDPPGAMTQGLEVAL